MCRAIGKGTEAVGNEGPQNSTDSSCASCSTRRPRSGFCACRPAQSACRLVCPNTHFDKRHPARRRLNEINVPHVMIPMYSTHTSRGQAYTHHRCHPYRQRLCASAAASSASLKTLPHSETRVIIPCTTPLNSEALSTLPYQQKTPPPLSTRLWPALLKRPHAANHLPHHRLRHPQLMHVHSIHHYLPHLLLRFREPPPSQSCSRESSLSTAGPLASALCPITFKCPPPHGASAM